MLLGIVGGQEIMIIVLIVILLFGINKIPGLMKNIGKGVKQVSEAKKEITDSFDDFNIKNHLP